MNKLGSYFSAENAKRIKKNRSLRNKLEKGCDMNGYFVMISENYDMAILEKAAGIVKNANGLFSPFGLFYVCFFSKELFCEDIENAVFLVSDYLKANSIIHSGEYGSILIGHLASGKPLFIGTVMNKIISKIREVEGALTGEGSDPTKAAARGG